MATETTLKVNGITVKTVAFERGESTSQYREANGLGAGDLSLLTIGPDAPDYDDFESWAEYRTYYAAQAQALEQAGVNTKNISAVAEIRI